MNKFEVLKFQFSFNNGNNSEFLAVTNHGNAEEFQTYAEAEKYINQESLKGSEKIYYMFIIDRSSRGIVGIKSPNDNSVTKIP